MRVQLSGWPGRPGACYVRPMQGVQPVISHLAHGSPEERICAAWRHEAFLKEDGYSLAGSLGQLQNITALSGGSEAALIARAGADLAGLCLLVNEELEPAHDVSPWLASLYVAPAFRRQGIARLLVRAIEDEARRRGAERLHLYTADAAPFYLKCGWTLREEFTAHGVCLRFMSTDL